MKIGYDISQTGKNKAGCGYFSDALIQAILKQDSINSYSLYPSFGDFFFDRFISFFNPYPTKNTRYGTRHLTKARASNFWNSSCLEKDLKNPDVIHSNNYWCPVNLRSTRLIYTFYDMGFTIDPTWTMEANRIGCFDGVFKSSIAADWVIAISNSSREHYLYTFPHFPEKRIQVINPCSRFPNADKVGKRPSQFENKIRGDFWLSVGTIEPRKNQRRLLEAYKRYLTLGGPEMPLVLAGGKGWLMDDFDAHIHSLGIQDHVFMLGYATDDELIWLYRNCYANLYPSLFEGFGLPILEGMQFGAATLCSNSSSLPEVTGDAALLLPALDIEAWAQTMFRISSNKTEQEYLREASKKQAALFSWENCAAAVLALYEQAVNSSKR
jgi:glycosyltransferase involved in cell wall biosynthesis